MTLFDANPDYKGLKVVKKAKNVFSPSIIFASNSTQKRAFQHFFLKNMQFWDKNREI